MTRCLSHAAVAPLAHLSAQAVDYKDVHVLRAQVVLPPNTQLTHPKPCASPAFLHCSKDKPEDLGFPAVEPAAAKPAAGKEKPKPNVLKQLVNNVLKNPFIWGMALTYFFIYIVRQVRQPPVGLLAARPTGMM